MSLGRNSLRALVGPARTSRKSFQPCLRKPFGCGGASSMAAEFTAAMRSIPCHRRTENLVGNVVVSSIHVGCPPPIRCQRDFLLPEKIRLTHYASNPGKPVRPWREHKSRQAASELIHPFGLLGQSLLSSWLNILVPPRTPTSPDCLARRSCFASCAPLRLCLRKDHRPNCSQLPPQALWLSTCNTLPRYGVSSTPVTTDAPVTNPAAAAVPALVSFFALRVPWVSWFPSLAISFLGAAVKPSYSNKGLTDKVRPLISGYESRRSPYRETFACPQDGWAIASPSKSRHRPSQNLPASPFRPFMVELFALRDLL